MRFPSPQPRTISAPRISKAKKELGMVTLLLLLSVALILIQQIEFRIIYAQGQATIEIDYSVFTIILRKDKNPKKARNRARILASLIRPTGFLTKRSSLTLKELTLPIDKNDPGSAILKDRYFKLTVLSALSLLSFFTSSITLYEGSLDTTPTGDHFVSPTVDLAVKCRLYHIFYSGLLFLIEYIKRNEKNGRKQNE